MDHRGVIRAALEAEWNAATEIRDLIGSANLVIAEGPEPKEHPIRKDNRTFSFKGQRLRPSGDIWFGAFMAPGDRYAAVRSFNGWWDSGRAARDGPLFIDVYDTARGVRLAVIHGNWCDYGPDEVFHEMAWISDHEFLLPFGDKKRDILACRFDARN